MRLIATGVSWRVESRTIIEGISLVAEPGTVTGLLGPNGSGKTTLLNVLAGIQQPSAGRIVIGGDDLRQLRGRERAQRVAYVEQQASTSLDLTVRQVVELGRTPHRSWWHTVGDSAIVDSAMAASQVSQLAEQSWLTLSGGERQRTQLARALAQQPRVLLLDEPTNHLDLGHQIDFLKTVRGLGITTIAALHDLELAAAFCDRLVVLQDGHVAAQGPVAEALTTGLLAEVYGVRGTVSMHSRLRRSHVMWSDVVAGGVVGSAGHD